MGILSKFSLALIGMILVAVVSVSTLALRSQQQTLTKEAVLRGQTIAKTVSTGAFEAILTNDPVTLITLAVEAVRNNPGVDYVVITDRNEKILAHSIQDKRGEIFQLENPEILEDFTGVSHAVIEGNSVWNIAVLISGPGTERDFGKVHVGVSTREVAKVIQTNLTRLGIACLILLTISGVISFFMVKVLVQPIRELSAAASEIGKGSLVIELPVRSSDELGHLVANFNSMVSNLAAAEKVKLEKERIQGELNVAHTIQSGLIPLKGPEIKDLDIDFTCIPAKELGGDFLDWFMLEKGKKLGILIADVSGKGVPAALHMANLRNLFRFAVHESSDPAVVVKRVNSFAWPDLKGESFVTLTYLVLDLITFKMDIVTAGHDPLIYWPKARSEPEYIRGKGMPIGIAEPEDFDFVLKSVSKVLNPGDLIFLYTDGITEAMNEKQEQFGRDNMVKVLANMPNALAAKEIILKAVREHANGVEQSDDITLFALKRV
jgi:serine phosphatase RsbU (regulator of sigma subunit)